ncbi:MAG: DcrB-related protein [Acidobacteriota bacterium]
MPSVQEPDSGRRKKQLIGLLLIVVFCIGTGLGVLFLIKNNNDKKAIAEQKKAVEAQKKYEADVKKSKDVPDFLPYYDKVHKVEVERNTSWYTTGQVYGIVFTSNTYPDRQKDVFLENINLMVIDQTKRPMTLDQYTRETEKTEQSKLQKYKLLQSAPCTFAGQPGHQQVISASSGSKKLDLKLLQVWTIKDNKAYVFTYSAEPKMYEKNMPTVERIIKSVRINVEPEDTRDQQFKAKNKK